MPRMMERLTPLCQITIVLMSCLIFASPATSQPPKPFAIYVLGDSSVDTGNRNKTWSLVNQVWRPPYGITYPGFPAGRASDGNISTDFLAELIELPTPRPFSSINASSDVLEFQHGVNFAVGGAGVFTNFGLFANYSQQVDQLKGLIDQNPLLYAPGMIVDSMILFFNGGNDYIFFAVGNPNATIEDYLSLTRRIVQGVEDNLRSLFDFGFRKFAVSNLQPTGCLPQVAGSSAASACDTASLPINSLYNSLLHDVIAKLQATLQGTQFIELDLFKAVNLVVQHPQWFGFNNPLVACCQGTTPEHLCSDVDAGGNPLYTVCAQPEKAFFWDYGHLSQAGWRVISTLFYSSYNITSFAPNMAFWINSFNFRKTHIQDKDPEKLVPVISDLVHAIAKRGDYSAVLEKANSTGALGYLPSFLSRSGPLTVFLPNDSAIACHRAANWIWTSHPRENAQHTPAGSPEAAIQLVLRQAVYGWWPPEELLKLDNGHRLRTVAGTYVRVFVDGATIYLGAAKKDGGVTLLLPSLASAPEVVLVHGTDGVIGGEFQS